MQSAFAWVLNNPNISILVKSMNSIDDIKNCLAASGKEFGASNQKILDYYGKLIENSYCKIGCGDCLSSCPQNVAINDIMRYRMYFENYSFEKEGILSYRKLQHGGRADVCKDCEEQCKGACPNGLNIRQEMIRAHELLTV